MALRVYPRFRNLKHKKSARKWDLHSNSVPRQLFPATHQVGSSVASIASQLTLDAAERRECDMNHRIDLFRLPLEIVTSCILTTTARRTTSAHVPTSLAVTRSTVRSGPRGARHYSQVRNEGPLYTAKIKTESPYKKMSRAEDHQASAAGLKHPPIPKPSSRFV